MWIDFSLCFTSAEGDSRTKVLGRLTTVFQRLVGLGETRDQLKQFRYNTVTMVIVTFQTYTVDHEERSSTCVMIKCMSGTNVNNYTSHNVHGYVLLLSMHTVVVLFSRRTFDSEEQRSLGPYHSLLAQVTRVTSNHCALVCVQKLRYYPVLGPSCFILQVVDGIFNPSKPDLPDLEYHSHGLADILKSGFRCVAPHVPSYNRCSF